MWSLGGYVVAFLVIGVAQYWVYRWRNPKCRGRLPPGSMGLPLIGETIQFLIPSKSIDIPRFIKTRNTKYGPIFKTSLVGCPMVVSLDPEFNYYILQQEGKLVDLWYMDSFAKLFGQTDDHQTNSSSYIVPHSHVHKYVRSLVLNQVGAEAIQSRIITQVGELSRKTLLAWSTRNSLEVKSAASSMLFDFAAEYLYGYEPEKHGIKNMSETFTYLIKGVLSFPLNIPGTTFHKCMQNQKICVKLMKDLLEERRRMPKTRRGDFIDHILDDMNKGSFVSDDFATFLMFGILFATTETISSALTLAIKLLTEHPMAITELEREHEEILHNRENNKGNDLTWDEYKSMNFTMQVVKETLRIGSMSPGIFRKAIKDIPVNGYTIPKGWIIMAVPSAIMLNPETFKDPLSFNPWRWKDNLRPIDVAKNFIPFGGGTRMCAGAEFTKAFLAGFLHVLVSHYRFEKVKEGGITRSPFLKFGDGLYIKIHRKDDAEM